LPNLCTGRFFRKENLQLTKDVEKRKAKKKGKTKKITRRNYESEIGE
jgi:hypothetical protein